MYSALEYDENSLTEFICFLILIGKGWMIAKIKPAITFFAEIEGWQVLTDPLYSRVKAGATKIWHLCDKSQFLRDPIMGSYIADYITLCKPTNNNGEELYNYRLTCAILIIGFRILSRPSDLADLEWGDVTYDSDGLLYIDLAGHKTDKNRLAKPEVVDPIEESNFCPIKILKIYMDSVAERKTKHSPLFSYPNNKFISRDDIQKIITTAIKRVKPTAENIKGHSLRIGGATELLKQGESLESIMAIGNWKSELSARLYMRKIANAFKGISSIMLDQLKGKKPKQD